MKSPCIPPDEASRLASLESLDLLDTAPEECFDRYTRLAKRSFDVPIALVSLVDRDRQWFKSSQGLEARETPRDISFCGHSILDTKIMVVKDTALDDRFVDNPLVVGEPRIRFYAGCPLAAPDGSNIGTLCLIDDKPRDFSDDDFELLRDLTLMLEDDLKHRTLATIDPLTGLSNRRGFAELAEHTLSLCKRVDRPVQLLFLDIDNFKQINDRLGHAAGDHALCELSELLLTLFRDTDVIGRHGGDEFCVLLAGSGGVKEPLVRLEEALANRNADPDADFALECSAGIVEFDPELHQEIGDLLSEADRKMYDQKRSRRRA